MSLGSLRERVARAIYEDRDADNWDALPEERRKFWLGDADRVIPVVLDAVTRVIDQRDEDSAYLVARENLADVLRGTFLGAPDEEATDD